MNENGNPCKKPRWDADFNGHGINNDAFEDDDLWGQGELTAEEFDFVEIQATQRLNNTENMCRQEEVDRQQFALEGQIKHLGDSLDKTVKELNLERSNREGIIAEKIAEFKKNECQLSKEIERMKTVIQFKDQEMKSIQNKLHTSENKLKDQVNQSQQLKTSPSKNTANVFLNRFSFNVNKISTKESSVQTLSSNTDSYKQYKLSLQSPEGAQSYPNTISSFLTTRRFMQCTENKIPDVSCQNSSVAFAHLNMGTATEELWQYFETTLKQHVLFLQQLKETESPIKNPPVVANQRGVALPQTISNEEIEQCHTLIMTCLKDLKLLPNANCSQSGASQKNKVENKTEYDDMEVETKNDSVEIQSKRKELVFTLEHLSRDFPKTRWDYLSCSELLKSAVEPDITSHSCPLFKDDEKANSTPETNDFSFFSPLLMLVKPDTYPDCFVYKEEELCSALSVVLEWCTHKCMSFDRISYILPVQELVSGSQGMTCATLTLQILSQVMIQRNIEVLFHRNDNCLFTSIANLCLAVSYKKNEECLDTFSSIQSFICQCLSNMDVTCLNDENCSCSIELAQGVVKMLWNFHDRYHKTFDKSILNMEILMKGVHLLYQFSTKMRDYEAKKLPIADEYITLVYDLWKLSKEHSQLQNLQDMIQDLWDFQQDFEDGCHEHMAD